MGGAELMPENPLAHEAPIVIGLHIIGSSAFCLLGALQSLPSIRQHHRNLYKNLGRIAGAGGCISVITGLVMTHQFVFSSELQGELLYWVRMVVGTPCSLGLFMALPRFVTAIWTPIAHR